MIDRYSTLIADPRAATFTPGRLAGRCEGERRRGRGGLAAAGVGHTLGTTHGAHSSARSSTINNRARRPVVTVVAGLQQPPDTARAATPSDKTEAVNEGG